VFVDIDILSFLPTQLLVERTWFTSIVDVEYERLSLFFFYCKMIEHDLAQCRVFNTQNPAFVGPQQKSS